MENVRRYYSKVKQLLSQDGITNDFVHIETIMIGNESLDGIRNKLLTLPKENIIHYAKFIAEAVNEEIVLFEYYFNKDFNSYFVYDTLGIDYLLNGYDCEYSISIASLFKRFGVAMYVDESEVCEYRPNENNDCGTLTKRFYYRLAIENVEIEEPKPINVSDKKESATVAQKWTIIRNLMECAVGWRLTDDENKLNYNKTDISKLLAFLCGGSAEFIRKHLEDELPIKDVSTILPYLEKVGLHEIVKRIK